MENENSFEYLDRRSKDFFNNLLSEDSEVENAKYKAMRSDFLSVSDKFKGDEEKLKSIMKDWVDYCHCLIESRDYSNDLIYNEDREKDNDIFTKLDKIRKFAESIEKNLKFYWKTKLRLLRPIKF